MKRVFWVIGLLLVINTVWAQGWKAGVARVAITPKASQWMAGYAARTRPAEGKLHDLWAKALALEDEKGNLGSANITIAELGTISLEMGRFKQVAYDLSVVRDFIKGRTGK